jgi:hypothetical protein
MNCQDVLALLTAYADGELLPTEKKAIEAHLAGCAACQQVQATAVRLQSQLQQHLQARAENIAPAPQAWSRLEAALPAPRPFWSGFVRSLEAFFAPKGIPATKLSASRVAVVVLLLLALVVTVPPAWARLEPILTNWFHFTAPDGHNSGSIGDFTAFTPYHATYMPQGFQPGLLGRSTGPDLDTFEIGYDDGAQFITILQSKGQANTALPVGQPMQVGEHTAVFIQTFATSQAELQEKRPAVSLVTDYDYSHTHLLAWFIGEVKLEIFSNLPLDQMLLVAESLAPMEAATEEAR